MSTAAPSRSSKRTPKPSKTPVVHAGTSVGDLSARMQNAGWWNAGMNRLSKLSAADLSQIEETLDAIKEGRDRMVPEAFVSAIAGPNWCDKQKILAFSLLRHVNAVVAWMNKAPVLVTSPANDLVHHIVSVWSLTGKSFPPRLTTQWGSASVDVVPPGMPWLWYGTDEERKPDLFSDDVATEVRILFQTAHGKAHQANAVRAAEQKSQNAPEVSSERPAAGDFCSVPIEHIHVGTNIRQEFDPKRIDALAAEIARDGLLHPLTVRMVSTQSDGDRSHDYELIAGERRLRAVKQLGWSHVPVKLVKVDDQEAKWIQISENLKREDVSPLDKCFAVKQLRDLGMTQKEIAARMEISQPEVSNRERILSLPECILRHIRSGRVAATAARGLCSLQEHGWILEAVSKDINAQSNPDDWNYHAVWTELDLLQCAEGAVHDEDNRPLSRPMDSMSLRHFRDDQPPQFRPTAQQLKDLRTFTIKLPHRTKTFATNVELWDQLQADAGDGPVRTIGKGKPAAASVSGRTPESDAAAMSKRLWQYRVRWQQDRINEKPPVAFPLLSVLFYLCTQYSGGIERGQMLRSLLKTKENCLLKPLSDHVNPMVLCWPLVQDWLSQDPFGHGPIDAKDIEVLAELLGIRVADHWRVDEPFLQLHTKDQLRALCKEWKITTISLDAKKSDLVTLIMNVDSERQLPAPKSLLKAK